MFSLRQFVIPALTIVLCFCGVGTAQEAAPEVKDLAVRLLATPTPSERQALLSQHSNLVGSDLAFAVLDEAHQKRARGELKQALAAAQLALTIAERANAGSAQARALADVGLVQYDEGNIQEAMDWFQKSLKVSETIHDDRIAAVALNGIGNVYKDLGEFSLAIECYQKNLVLGEKLHDDQITFRAVGNLGIINTERGDYVQAFAYAKRAADLAEHFGEPRAKALVFINMGAIFERQGDYAQAEAYAQRALELAEPAGDRLKAAVALLNLGTANQFQGDLTNALRNYERSRNISEAIGDRLHASVNLTHMGSVRVTRKEYAAAIDLYQQSLRIQEEMGAREDAADTLLDLALVHNLKGDFAQALEAAARGQELAGAGGYIQPVWRAHLRAGTAYRGLKQMARSETEFTQAISVIEDMRTRVAGDESEQAGFFGDRLEPYSRMIELLATEGRNAQAFEYAERAKARVLVDVLRAGRSQLDTVLTADERRRDQELRTQLASLNVRVMRDARATGKGALQPELEKVRLQYAAFQTNLYVAHPEIKTQRGEVEPIRAEEAQRLAGPETAFVEFAVSSEKLFVFVSSGTSGQERSPEMHVFAQPIEEKALGELVQQFRRQLANRDLGFRATAARLYQVVLGPATPYLKGKTQLVIVPDGVLWELPFQALVDPAGRYLLDDAAVSYAPSLTALKAMMEVKKERRRTPGKMQLLAMGNPTWGRGEVERVKAIYRDESLGSLPLAETEVARLGRIYGEDRSHVYIGREARESRFKTEAADSNVLHLATHGILNNASPLYSYLLLAGEGNGGPEDGLLEARELLQMKLHAELAVLSACETARGRVGTGEGMIGLSWALFVSGVPTTVLSQWKVESDSTSQLMVAFHQNRQKSGSDAQALRAAALAIRKNPAYQHPFYWAPFIVIGAGLN
ncbi:MAG TPA: CHAT domain-containing tetratricopeptide repeat protein [Bryobacteraceae bacterium]|jgi:CHAT domain-containing protein/Tfp pilus assembly protein PilF|nr:CHAT domain-containing tetratricopeptide repeat protein [Bryobacteraceae bacterium]